MKIEKDLLIDILTRAKYHLPESGYVCCAIESTVRTKSDRAHADYLQRWIEGSLGEHSTVRSWLIFDKGIRFCDVTNSRLYEYRLAWIDDMIEALKKGLK